MNSLKLAHAHNRLQRNDLLHLLNRSQAFALTLILAPAGSGKSTLLQQWRLQNAQLPMAHVGLTRRDQDPIVFLRHLHQALQKHVNILPVLSFNALDATPEQAEILAQSLVEAFESLENDFFLILDDFHCASASIIQQLFANLLANLPPHIHVIIASRSHPDFSLSRLKLDDLLLVIIATICVYLPLNSMSFANYYNNHNLMTVKVKNYYVSLKAGWQALNWPY